MGERADTVAISVAGIVNFAPLPNDKIWLRDMMRKAPWPRRQVSWYEPELEQPFGNKRRSPGPTCMVLVVVIFALWRFEIHHRSGNIVDLSANLSDGGFNDIDTFA